MADHSEIRSERADHVEHDGDSIDIREFSRIFWRRRYTVLSVLLAGISIATIFVATITPRYTAQSVIVFQSDSKKITPQDYFLPFSLNTVDFAFLLTELEILKSEKLAAQVIKKLNLTADNSTQGILDGSGLQPRFKDMALNEDKLRSLSPESLDEETSKNIKNMQNSLKVVSVPGSTLVNVNFTSPDPYKAALVANTLVDTYREMKMAEKYEVRRKLMSWLEQRLKEVRAQVFETETAIEKFKAENDITQGKRELVSYEKLGELNRQLAEAQARYLDIKSQFEQFDKQSSYDIAVGSYSKIINVSTLKELQAEKRRIETELSQLSNRYGAKHPEIIDRKTKLVELNKTIDEELKLSRRAVQNELQVAQAHIDDINEKINEAGVKYQDDSESMIALRELEREAEASKMVLKTLLETYQKSAGQNDALESLGVEVLSYASIPHEASYPNKKLLLSLAAFISLSLGLMIALLIEKLDNVFRRPQELEKTFGMPCHVALPALKGLSESEQADYILSQPSSPLAEAVRTLRITLNFENNSGSETQNKTILITSSRKDEGKTALSVWLARLSAKGGEKVILIDANLRNPKVHKFLGSANDSSLVDFLSGQKKLEETVKKDKASGLDFICGQAVPNTAFDLISTKKLQTLVDALRQKYDIVIINAPPSYEMPDAKAMSKLADQTLYIVAANKTAREYVYEGVRYFIEKGQHGFGFIMSNFKA